MTDIARERAAAAINRSRAATRLDIARNMNPAIMRRPVVPVRRPIVVTATVGDPIVPVPGTSNVAAYKSVDIFA